MPLVGRQFWQVLFKKNFAPKNGKSFGIETTPLYRDKAIEFWVNPKMMPKGVVWIFPCGEFSRMGIASYLSKTKIKEGLEIFL